MRVASVAVLGMGVRMLLGTGNEPRVTKEHGAE